MGITVIRIDSIIQRKSTQVLHFKNDIFIVLVFSQSVRPLRL